MSARPCVTNFGAIIVRVRRTIVVRHRPHRRDLLGHRHSRRLDRDRRPIALHRKVRRNAVRRQGYDLIRWNGRARTIWHGWTDQRHGGPPMRLVSDDVKRPHCFAQKQPRTFASALQRVAAVEVSKIRFHEIFGIVRFSTFATISANNDHACCRVPGL
jgi:hypothetical protein